MSESEHLRLIDEWGDHKGTHLCFYVESDDGGTAECPGDMTLKYWLELNGYGGKSEPVKDKEYYMNYPDDDNPVKNYLEAHGMPYTKVPEKPSEVPVINAQDDEEELPHWRDLIPERLDMISERLGRIEDALAERSEATTLTVKIDEGTVDRVENILNDVVDAWRRDSRLSRESLERTARRYGS